MHARSLVPGFPGWLLVLSVAAAALPAVPGSAEAQRVPVLSAGDSVRVSSRAASPLPSRVRMDLGPEDNHWDAPPDRSMEFPRSREWERPDLTAWGRYNRVEGVAIHALLRRNLDRETFAPATLAQIGYAFAAKRGQYRLRFEQPVAPKNKITIGGEAHRSFLPFFYQEESLSSEENSSSAFFLHRDYWDWYEADGVRGFLTVRPSPFLTLSGGVMRQDETSLVNRTDWSLFRQGDDFRLNPAIPNGDVRSWEAAVTFDSRPRDGEGDLRERPTWDTAQFYRVSWERAGGGLGGDYDLWRVFGEMRNYFRLSSQQFLATRVLAGTGDSNAGFLPVQRRYAIGGLGTLRGHNFRDLSGDHVAMANLEYSFNVGGEGWVLVFLDTGTAWDAGELFDQKVAVDVGSGFRLGNDGITILAAQSVNDTHADPKFYVRLKESF